MGVPAATDQASRDAFMKDVEAFEAKNPDITIEPTDLVYDPSTFTTLLAGGDAPSLLVVPFTQPAALIERQQIADISADVSALGLTEELNPAALDVLRQGDALYGLAENVYALGLVYNRALFEKAGLDPDAPPTTWEEVRKAAKAINAATGVAGFASMTTENGGGWQLTAQTVSGGGRMQQIDGDRATASVDNDAARDILRWQHTMRWEDQSIGSNMLRNQQDVERAFAAGEAAMVIATPSFYNRYINQYSGAPEQFGVTSMPQADSANQTLIGGTALVVPATATPAERSAAVKWMDYRYVEPKRDTERAAAQAQANAADGVAVGIPLLPLFDEATQTRINEAIEPSVNIPRENFAPYIDGVRTLEYVPEPPVATQEMYALLDTVVQAVLTQENADVDQLLSDAQASVDSLLQSQP
ncbi:ABC transporter substrate-binding protein [Microbacterium testaceum]|nr:extracellular solute-binding protein [Microbacterium testaceum]